MTTAHAALARLLAAWDASGHHWRSEYSEEWPAALAEARRVVEQSAPGEGEGLTDEELKAAYWEAFHESAMCGAEASWLEFAMCGAEASWLAGLRAVARATVAADRQRRVVPVPVSERLPGEEDCDAEGRCWLLTVEDEYPQWRLHSVEGHQPGGRMIWVPVDRTPGVMVDAFYASHWLPAHAIPLPAPQGGEVEA